MPELPEVETTRRGIEPHLVGHRIERVTVHQPSLRWPVPDTVQQLVGGPVVSVRRRAKYLLIEVSAGAAIVHLGMSGSLRLVHPDEPRRAHDHIELAIDHGGVLRYHDPRRFGCLLWQARSEPEHRLLASLGPEPLGDRFDTAHLFATTRGKKVAIKVHLMNAKVVVGVGNIYASEALFMAGIRPGKAAGRLTRKEAATLVDAVREVLARSIAQGGTTLRDFVGSDGTPGYFAQQLFVYGRAGKPCRRCESEIRGTVLGQRSTFWCASCQR